MLENIADAVIALDDKIRTLERREVPAPRHTVCDYFPDSNRFTTFLNTNDNQLYVFDGIWKSCTQFTMQFFENTIVNNNGMGMRGFIPNHGNSNPVQLEHINLRLLHNPYELKDYIVQLGFVPSRSKSITFDSIEGDALFAELNNITLFPNDIVDVAIIHKDYDNAHKKALGFMVGITYRLRE